MFECARFPTLPPSDSGESVVSFSMMPRFTAEQLALYGATKFGALSKDVAEELAAHCTGIKTLTKLEKDFALRALAALAA